ncbi:hypothetical protein HLH44_06880 [Gluconacetobacter sp. 1c LMG 22058]|uniref:OmpA-like domain-containing protein n=1 Tax=Gluconacetobacter dulcium TaxID=2729096 RepID=A0A7W4JYR6_9PROT|nr:hypothetical protein [Gluconacetobacter dulcium]MBB2197188.1 hypothetical protein [Gluconacetobacter dulcium]
MPDIRPALPSRSGPHRRAGSRATLATLAALGGLAVTSAHAQVTTDDSALSALPATKVSRPAPHAPATRPAASSAPSTTTPAPTRPAPAHAAPPPTIPAAPPPPPVIRPPVVDVPLHPPAPPPEVPAKPDAQGSVTDRPGGLRVTFAAGSTDMNAAMIDGVQHFAATLLQAPYARAEIDATASGAADDVSTPRRLSLARGLAIRSILIHAGVATTRIYVRAIGVPAPATAKGSDSPNETSPDHVDVTRSDMVASAPPPSPAPSEQRSAP